jgi:acyl-CoA hydrolase
MNEITTPSSTTCLIDIVFPGDTNHHGTLFGGVGLAYMAKVAFIAASRHARVDFVIASCEQIDFKAPAHLGDIIELNSRIVRVGKRSLSVEVAMIAEATLSGERRLCGRGIFNMVVVGNGLEESGGKLPPLSPDLSTMPDGALRVVELTFPDQTSHYGSLYGGNALAAMAKSAFVVATRHANNSVIEVAV